MPMRGCLGRHDVPVIDALIDPWRRATARPGPRLITEVAFKQATIDTLTHEMAVPGLGSPPSAVHSRREPD
jgi:hypothetical protein